ncbi:PREDICTED: uncharacterized protein LOC105367624 [Ceratosolen solmsi marchali]|uniref:Uncharacterized protein LOC105367624 n=1 Tax=Ceratosolen solmsi marchali TaxID=326594 RepID=A0AAJ6YUP3_9HYME|nr:PREDICTED: uncharacterized protein LOC105367624 [Ceratosolen solmsi marchali]
MTLNTDISTALHLLEHVHERVEDCDDPKLQLHTSQDLQSLISLLEDPVFRSIVTIQDSLAELNSQLGQHPSILPGDFDISLGGQLELSVPNTPVQPVGQAMYQNLYQDTEIDDQRVPVAPLLHSSSEETSTQVTSPSLISEVIGMPPIMTPTYAKEFQKVIETAAKGRQIFTVQLYKSEGTSLGFSVVGLRSKDRGELGIFLQEIQPNGIAGSDGRLVEGDQILAIDGQPLDSNISHEQAISILQKARGLVELIVARSAQDIGNTLSTDELSGVLGASAAAAGGGGGGSAAAAAAAVVQPGNISPDKEVLAISVGSKPPVPQLGASTIPAANVVAAAAPPTAPATAAQSTTIGQGQIPGGLIERSNSAVSDASKGGDMVLNTEWAQVEVINLINDGSGLGFGIIGGRSTGVVVKTILPGGVADRDNRLQSGDHILQIGDVNLRGMGSEQVAAVLRQSGTHVRLVVARPIEPTSPDYQALGSHAPIVPTKILGDPDELDRHLLRSGVDAHNLRRGQGDTTYDNGTVYGPNSELDIHGRTSLILDVARSPLLVSAPIITPSIPGTLPIGELPVLSMETVIDVNALPEMERFTVELKKDSCGLGITIAGYVCEKEELSGIFVKSISEGSAADLSQKIQINDRIVEVNGHSLQGYSNHEAVEVLRSTGQTVILCLERYLRGPKYEQLQQAIAASELRLPQPSSPSITSLPTFPISADGDTTIEIEPEGESHTTVDSTVLQEIDRDVLMGNFDDITNIEALLSDPSTELTPKIEIAIKVKWQKIVGPDIEIVVAQLKKFAEGSGLGISLEGTVDVENGQEVRPHHYIRSILPEGPVGQNGILRSGDELLEVNGYRLLGINHMEVVSVLKELPIHVRMICGRNIASQDPLCPIDTAQHQAAFQTRSILGGSLQNLLPTSDRLVKAKSDGSLASTTTTATVTDASLNKMKSRSLEPLTGLAMWSSEPQIIELVKGERGLGFSILDYQDPMNPNETVIVIRSLVPGGVAQVDGQLIPGDRLLFVNDIALENATLDQAVQALKGAPKGIVRIGVAKPLPIPDSIAQRLAPICIVRRSRSLSDSDATDHVADFNDFLSSQSGMSDDAAVGENADTAKVKKDTQMKNVNIPYAGGVPEVPPRTRRKEIGDQDQHSTLIKLSPFSEERRRAMVSETLKTPEEKPMESVSDEAAVLEWKLQENDVLNAILEGLEVTIKSMSLAYQQAYKYHLLLEVAVESIRRRKSTPCAGEVSKSSNRRKRSLPQDELQPETLRRRNLRHQESIDRVTHYLDMQQREPSGVDELMYPSAESRFQADRAIKGVAIGSVEEGDEVWTLQSNMKLLDPEKPVETATKRRSSLRRRREDPVETVINDMQEDTVKKTVRICSVDEEIRIERFDSIDTDEWIPFAELQEVQLVTAKILTAEEAADNISKRDQSLRDPSMDGRTTIANLISDRSIPEARVPPSSSLKPSASENAIAGIWNDDNMISEKNIDPKILMDLSRVTSDLVHEQCEQYHFDEEHLTVTKPKRKLSRVSSDSACGVKSNVTFHFGDNGCFNAEMLSDRHSQVNLVAYELKGVMSPTRRIFQAELSIVGKIHCDSVKDNKFKSLINDNSTKKWRSPQRDRAPASRHSATPGVPRLVRVQSVSFTAANFRLQKPTCAEEIPWTRPGPVAPTRLQRASSEGSKSQVNIDSSLQPVDQRLRNRSVSDALVPKEEPPPKFAGAKNDGKRREDDAVDAIVAGNGLTDARQTLDYQRQSLESLLEPGRGGAVITKDLDPEKLVYSSCHSLPSNYYKSFESPKREVHTQTQGEHKSTQYKLEDLAEFVGEYCSRERLQYLLEERFGSPRREVEVQTEQECKAVQCNSEELEASDEFGPFFRKQVSFGSPKREAQVQTGQDTKSTQYDLTELGEPRLRRQDSVESEPSELQGKRAVECSASSHESSSPSSSSPPQRRAPPLILLLKGGVKADMTVTHRDKDGNVVWAKHWGPERLVEIYREHQTSLGLSIVGGKIDLQESSSSSSSQNVSGIFIKNVLPNSPAGRAGGLQTGDRIIKVDGVDLRNSTHERAVKAIQAAGNPVRLLVQSLVHLSPDNEGSVQDKGGGGGGDGGSGGVHRSTRRQSTRHRISMDGDAPGSPTSSFRYRSGSPSRSSEVIQEGKFELNKQATGGMSDDAGPSGRRSSMKKSMRKRAPSPPINTGILREVSEEPEEKLKPEAPEPLKNKYSSGESSEDEEDTRDMEGNVYTKNGVEISRKSAGNVKRSKEEIAADPEEEDEFGYTTHKVKKKYGNLKKPVFLVKLEKDRRGLGISLAGHKDRNKMAVFICGLNPSGVAFKNGEIQVGDELLEVNGTVFQGRCHLNASSMIKGMAATTFKLVVVRRPSGIENCAVKQVLQFPTALAGEDYSQFKGVRTLPIKKGTYGLGIMIIEGKHAEVGQGIFVSDIQVGSAAEQAGLNVGDMILSVNSDTVMGATYEEATSLLKKSEGVVTLTVCNPNQSKVAEEEERKARGEPVELSKEVGKEPEKPKEPEAPADPKDCKINNNKDTTIEFAKDKDKPIGFTVVGGNDTPLNGVFVLDVFPDGAAGKDGRLQPGDRIVDINKESFKSMEQDKAYQTVLRIIQGPIIMIVHRDEKAVEEFEIELTKKSGKGSGLCLIGYKSGKGAYVSEVVAGGSAAESGKIVKGDRIVAVGGQELREAPVEDIALHVKVSNPVQLKLARYKSK